jgi:hypothetical protein
MVHMCLPGNCCLPIISTVCFGVIKVCWESSTLPAAAPAEGAPDDLKSDADADDVRSGELPYILAVGESSFPGRDATAGEVVLGALGQQAHRSSNRPAPS